MSTSIIHVHEHPPLAADEKVGSKDDKGRQGQWWRFALIAVVTAVLIVPVIVVFILAVRPGPNSGTTAGFTLGNFTYVFEQTSTLIWLGTAWQSPCPPCSCPWPSPPRPATSCPAAGAEPSTATR